MKNIFKAAVLGSALALSAQANATIFDFQDLVDNGNEDGGTFLGTLGASAGVVNDVAANGEAGFSSFDWTKDGVTVTASAANGHNAYLDKGVAGLGVCKVLTATDQCNPGNDDNVTFDEILQLTFSQVVAVDLSQSIFRDKDHNVQSPVGVVEYNAGAGWVALSAANSQFSTNAVDFRVAQNGKQFYIDAVAVNVPEPGTFALLGLGLLGLGAARKKA